MRAKLRQQTASCDSFKALCILTIFGMVITTFMFWSSSNNPKSLTITNETYQEYQRGSSNATFSGPQTIFSQIPSTTVDSPFHFIPSRNINPPKHFTTVTNQPINISIDQLHHDSTVQLDDPNTIFLELRISKKPQNGYYNLLIPNTRVDSQTESQLRYPTIIYTPKDFYVGTDSFTYEIYYLLKQQGSYILREQANPADNKTRVYKESGSIEFLIKITPVLTRQMLKFPSGYNSTDMRDAVTNTIENLRIMSLPEFRNAVPEKDFWYDTKWESCALVFNGGSLRNRSLGAEIDAHQKVFRLNGAPLFAYANDVGLKMDIGISAPLRYGCWVWADKLKNTEHIWYFGQMNMAPQYEHLAFCQPRWKPKENIFGLSWQFIELANNVFASYSTNYTRSTGYLMFLMASTMCDEVSVYGMGDSPDGQHHYFESPKGAEKAWSGHSYKLEKQIFEEIAAGDGKWKKLFGDYIVTRSFKFV